MRSSIRDPHPDAFAGPPPPGRGRTRPRARAGLLITLVVLLTAACAGRRTPLPPSSAAWSPEPLWAAVIDAGSSGSRIYLYRWWPAAGSGIPRVQPEAEYRVEPGLSSLVERPEAIGEALEPLIAFAVDRIGGDLRDYGRYPLHLKATGGLRLLSDEQQRIVLDAAAAYLATTPFRPAPPEVISGQMEGVYGWISVNYLLGYLDDGGPYPSAGALDLGGASTQITFVPLDPEPEEIVTLSIGGSHFPLYTHSYLGLGQDEARIAVNSPSCYPSGYAIPEGGVGAGDYDRCRDAVREHLAAPCEARSCSLMGVYQPPPYGDFFAFSAYTFAARFFDLGQGFALDRLQREGSAYCAKEWETIRRERAAELGNPYLPRHCFTAAYLVTLLSEGYGFALDSRDLLVPSELQGQEVGWTLGALIYELTEARLE